MKMDLRELVLVAMLCSMSTGLRCYKCSPNKSDYIVQELCEHFDYSEKYITHCADSTMCYKREITSSLGNGIKLYERDCAQQIMADDQELIDHKWVKVNKIYEPYKEGCEDTSKDGKVTTTVNCYCRGDLCNGAFVTRSGVMVVMGTLLFKYLIH